MSKKEKVMEILNNLNSESKMPIEAELNIDKQEYGDLIDAMLDERLISGTKPARGGHGNKVLSMFLDTFKISIRGMDYLEENSKYECFQLKKFSYEEILEVLNNKVYAQFNIAEAYKTLSGEGIKLTIEQTRGVITQLSNDGFISCTEENEFRTVFYNRNSKLRDELSNLNIGTF